jgi:hypothetical protein
MKELILHIGLPKTGTSSLQHYLAGNAGELSGQRICYPKTGRRSVAHHDLAAACRYVLPVGGAFKDLRRDFAAEVAAYDRVIVSSEGFASIRANRGVISLFGLPKRAVLSRTLLTPFSKSRDYRIMTVCYLREFLEMAASLYAQRIQRWGHSTDLDRFCAALNRRPITAILNFWGWFSDDFQVRLFDRNQLKARSIVDDFFFVAGIDMPGPATAHDANPSISGNLLSFKLVMNACRLHVPNAYGALSEIASKDPAYRGRFLIADAKASDLRRRFHRYNDRLSGLFGEVALSSFEEGNALFDLASWNRDVEIFLSHPGLSHLKEHNDFCRMVSDSSKILAFRQNLRL